MDLAQLMTPLEERLAGQLGIAREKARKLVELLRQETVLDYLGAAGSGAVDGYILYRRGRAQSDEERKRYDTAFTLKNIAVAALGAFFDVPALRGASIHATGQLASLLTQTVLEHLQK